MNTLQKHCSHLIAVLAAVALTACVKSDQANQPADSTAPNLTLAPTESTAAMKDVPVPATEPAKVAPKKKTPAPKPPAPKPAAPTTLTAAAGTRVPLAASESISTRQAKAGDAFTATVAQDVKDVVGHVVIPAGSAVQGTIVAAEPAPNPNASGRLELAVQTVSVRGSSYAVDATVESKDTVMQGRGVAEGDAAEVGGGEAAALVEDDVRQRLLVHARRRDRLRERHAVVHHVHDDLIHAVDDGRPARRPEHHEQPAVASQHDRRRHRRQHALVRRDGVGVALDQAIHVRLSRRGGEVVHLVVQKEAGARHRDRAAEAAVQRGGDRGGVARCIGG